MIEKYNEKKKIVLPKNFITLDEVIAKDVAEKVFERKFSELRLKIDNQEKLSWGIVVGVFIVFLFAIGSIIIDSISSRNIHSNEFNSINNKIMDQRIIIDDIKNEVDNIRIRNPYLK